MNEKPSADFVAALSAAADRLFQLTTDDPPLCRQLRAAAKAFLDATDPQQISHDLAVMPGPETVAQIDMGQAEVQSPLSASIANVAVSKPPPSSPITDADLPKVEAALRLKAEATRWAITRQRLTSKKVDFRKDIEPTDQQLLTKGKAQNCYLWMNRVPLQGAEVGHWTDVAACYETAAEAVALVQLALAEQSRQLETSLNLLAEAQSALHCAVGLVNDSPDSDQVSLHHWLKTKTAERQIVVKRFMRAADPADPDTSSDIAARIKALFVPLNESTQLHKRQEGRLRRIKYHLKTISDGSTTEHDWRTVVSTIEEMVGDGLPPSNVAIRELLLPHLASLPDYGELPVGFRRVLQEIDRFLETRSVEEPLSEPELPSADAKEARRILAGQSALFVGGRCRPTAKEALETALGLKELIWFETREHESLRVFEPYVARPDVGVVFVAIRWSSHSFGDLKTMCQKYGKRFVLLPAGYNPNQVALMVVQQLGSGQSGTS